MVVDPTNPNIAYLGGFGGDTFLSDTGLIRVDVTNIWDAHSLVAYDTFAADGGELLLATPGRPPINVIIDDGTPVWLSRSEMDFALQRNLVSEFHP